VQIIVEPQATTTAVALHGRFDAFEVEGFDTTVMSALINGEPQVRVNLSNVSFIDSSGLAALVRVMKRAREQGGDLVLIAPSDAARVILELTRLDAAFDIVDE